MGAEIAKKTCKLCCMEIPKEARKCPYCHHLQTRAATFMFHPAVHIALACLPMGVMLFVFGTIFDTGENYESYKDQIAITDSQLVFGETKSGATVAVIGTIRNKSPVPWKDIVFHVDFLDAAGKRADVGAGEQYTFHLPANGTSSFKVSFRREFSETNYVKAAVGVSAAKDARARW